MNRALSLPARAILDGLGQMGDLDAFAARQIGDGASQFEDAMIGAGAELELAHGGAQQAAAGVVDPAERAHLGHTHIGVGAHGQLR